ncbi:hypothetical protein Tco_0767024 [Tanacetum coccineum]
MDLYHSRLIQDDQDDLIIKYKIPRYLNPRLPSEEFVMSELPDDAIGIYHRMFNFFSVRIPFSLFLLDLIKHYRVYFSQLGPLGLNKVITFEAIPDAMVWRHSDATIDDPRPAAGSFSMADVRRLSAHVIKLKDIPECVLVLSGFSHVWKSRVYDPVLQGADRNDMGEEPHLDGRPTLQRLPFYCTPPAAVDAIILNPTLEDLSSTFGATSSHVAKRTSDGDDDACVEIPLVTPLRSATVIPSSGNRGRSSTAPTDVGPNTRDSRGKGIMADDAVAPSVGEFFKDPTVCKTMVDQFPTPGEMVRVEALSDDQLTAKMSVLQCIMMAHGGELLARYHGLLYPRLREGEEEKDQATVLEAEKDGEILGLKTTPPKFASFFHGQFYDLVQKFLASDEFSRVQGELLSTAASTGFERGLSLH